MQNWNYLQTLRSERILNGIDQNEALSTSLSNSLWSINNLTGSRLRNSISNSNECLTGKRGSTPSIRNGGLHPPITRTTSVGVHLDPKTSSSQRLNGLTEFGSNPSLYPGSTNSVGPLALERTSSLGGLSEKPCREHNMKMKTISEIQLGGMFSSEEFSSDLESCSRNRALDCGDEQQAAEELGSIDESLLSDDSSTHGSDTQITNSEIIDAAATAMDKSVSIALKLERSMPSLGKNLSPPKSPNISPLHHKLRSSLSIEGREGLHGASIHVTSGNSPSHLKSILRSPSNSITSLSSISPTHSSFHTPPMPSTPTSVSTSADRAHSVLLGCATAPHSHTIVPTSNSDTLKNEKSPSPSPSMDLEVVTCKTVIGDDQLLSPKRELHIRSNSDTCVDSMRGGGLQFHVTFVNDTSKRVPNISTLFEEDTALESTEGTASPALLLPNAKTPPSPIVRQSSDSILLSPPHINSRPHKVMFSECNQIRSFDSDSDSDIDDKITVVNDDLSVLDFTDPESDQTERVVNGHTSSENHELPDSHLDKSSQVNDEAESHDYESSESHDHESASDSQHHQTTTPASPTLSSVTDSRSRVDEKPMKAKWSAEAEKRTKVPPVHKRVTGKSVRALSQMFEGSDSSSQASSPVSSREISPIHNSTRRVSVSKIPLPCDSPVLNGPGTNKSHSTEVTTRNNIKSSKVSSTPPKGSSKSVKSAPSNTVSKHKGTLADKVAPNPEHSPTIVRKATPARKNSVYQLKSGVSAKPVTNTATRRASRVEHTSPVVGIPKHTSSPTVVAKKQPLSKAPVTKPKPSRKKQVMAGAKEPQPLSPAGSPKITRSPCGTHDRNPPKSRLQRQQTATTTSRSPSPHSSEQGSHKPLSRLSGTRQPMRKKSNNSSPAEVRRNDQHMKPATVADKLICNSNSNNNNTTCFDEDESVIGYFSSLEHFPDGSFLCPRRNESSLSLSSNSLQKIVKFSIGSASSQSSLDTTSTDGGSSCQLQCSSATGSGDSISVAHSSSGEVTAQAKTDDHDEKFKRKVDEFRYHHSLRSLSLKHRNKRSPLEWKNFGLSWKQNSLDQSGLSHSRVLTNSRTTVS